MKKLAVFVMLPALMLMAVTMASAGGNRWGVIHGEYAMIATGSCLHSTLGFNTNLTPVTGSEVWGAGTMAQATWQFEHNGTGTVKGTNYVIDFPPGGPIFGSAVARQNPIDFTFHYELTPDGEITVTFDNPALPPAQGMISIDHKTMTLGTANQIQPFAVGKVICNTGRVLIRVRDTDD